MNGANMTLEQIRLSGLAALARELGPVGMIRFLQQFETGSGNYSLERHQWLDQLDVETIVQQIQQSQHDQQILTAT
jgi:hypothetical protein